MQAGTAYRRGSAKMERRRWLRELTPLPVAHRDLLRVTLQAAFYRVLAGEPGAPSINHRKPLNGLFIAISADKSRWFS